MGEAEDEEALFEVLRLRAGACAGFQGHKAWARAQGDVSSQKGEVPQMKRCCHCKKAKPLGDFPRNQSRPDGIGVECKACCCARSGAWYRKNAEQAKRYSKRRRAENLELHREYSRRSYRRNPRLEQQRLAKMKRTDRLTDGVVRGHLKKKGLELTNENIQKHRERIQAIRAGRVLKAIAAAGIISRR
jgi:hypothetical protein